MLHLAQIFAQTGIFFSHINEGGVVVPVFSKFIPDQDNRRKNVPNNLKPGTFSNGIKVTGAGIPGKKTEVAEQRNYKNADKTVGRGRVNLRTPPSKYGYCPGLCLCP